MKIFKNELNKLADAIINSRSTALTERINKKAEGYELQRDELSAELTRLRLACENAALNKEEVVSWLKSFCKGDLFDENFRRRIIDVFINSVYLYPHPKSRLKAA